MEGKETVGRENSKLSGEAEHLEAFAVREREFYATRFEKGQQRGLIVWTGNAGLIALLTAVATLLPDSEVFPPLSVLIVALALLCFTAAAIAGLRATGPAYSLSNEIAGDPEEDPGTSGPGVAEERSNYAEFRWNASVAVYEQAKQIKRVTNSQAAKVLRAIRLQAVALLLLAIGILFGPVAAMLEEILWAPMSG